MAERSIREKRFRSEKRVPSLLYLFFRSSSFAATRLLEPSAFRLFVARATLSCHGNRRADDLIMSQRPTFRAPHSQSSARCTTLFFWLAGETSLKAESSLCRQTLGDLCLRVRNQTTERVLSEEIQYLHFRGLVKKTNLNNWVIHGMSQVFD